MTKERPILFSGTMVNAILSGTKTQTRRLLKPQPKQLLGTWRWQPKGFNEFHWDDRYTLLEGVKIERACPYGQAWDRLWVRETFSQIEDEYYYRANAFEYIGSDGALVEPIWKPSIFMPRAASRITLKITKVRCERLQDICENDAQAEGVEQEDKHGGCWYNYKDKLFDGGFNNGREAAESYRTLWESINGEGSWLLNPWVWVIEFKKL